MNIVQKLRHTARILSTRIQGHTTAAIAGAVSNPLSLLVTSTMRHAQQIQSNHPNIDVTSIDRIDQIHGRNGPVLIDHTAIAELANEAATRIEALQTETKRLETELAAASRDQQTLLIAQQTINDLQVQIAKLKMIDGECILKRANDGTISITSATDVFPCTKVAIQPLIDIHNQAIALKQAKGRHNTQIASQRLFDLLP